MFKLELYNSVKMNTTLQKKKKHYKMDGILRNHGHTVIRLAPYHFDLKYMKIGQAQLNRQLQTSHLLHHFRQYNNTE